MTDELPEEATPETAPQPPAPAVAPPGWPPQESGTTVPRGPRAKLPGRVTAAAVILLVFGTLAAFGSALTLLWSLFAMSRFGMFMDNFPVNGPMGWRMGFDGSPWGGGFLFFVLAVFFAVAVSGSHIAAGWATLQGLAWGRILGMVVSAVALVVLVLGVASTLAWVSVLPDFSMMDRVPDWWVSWWRSLITTGVTMGVIVSLAVGVAYGYVLWVLARAGDLFD